MKRPFIPTLLLTATAMIAACSHPPREPNLTIAEAPSSQSQSNVLEDDRRAAGAPIWLAAPQNQMPDSLIVFTRVTDVGPDHSPNERVERPNVLDMSRDSLAAEGTAQQLEAALATRDFPMRAIRLADGAAFDRYPAVLELQKLLASHGWREVADRPGLWVRQ